MQTASASPNVVPGTHADAAPGEAPAGDSPRRRPRPTRPARARPRGRRPRRRRDRVERRAPRREQVGQRALDPGRLDRKAACHGARRDGPPRSRGAGRRQDGRGQRLREARRPRATWSLIIDLATGKVVGRVDIGAGSRPHGLDGAPGRPPARHRRGDAASSSSSTRRPRRSLSGSRRATTSVPHGRGLARRHAAPTSRRSTDGARDRDRPEARQESSARSPRARAPRASTSRPTGARSGWRTGRPTRSRSSTRRLLQVVFTIRAAEFPIRVKITPDGQRAVVSFTGSGDVGVYDVATRAEVKRIPDRPRGRRRDPARACSRASSARARRRSACFIAPDGKRAWVSATHADVVAVIDLANLRVDDAWTAGRSRTGCRDGSRTSDAPRASAPPEASAKLR